MVMNALGGDGMGQSLVFLWLTDSSYTWLGVREKVPRVGKGVCREYTDMFAAIQ